MYSALEYLWFFMIYGFLGWSLEVAFHTVKSKKFVNRGFLNGPICPIYGFGMICLIFFLNSIMDNLFLLFIYSVLLTSILEFITGFILEKIFNNKWWDYTNSSFNICGYICLSFSLAWGFGSVFALNIIHPIISKLVSLLNNKIGLFILVILVIYLMIDFIVTILGIMKIKTHIRLLNDIAYKIRLYSDEIGQNIYKNMNSAVKAKNTVKDKLDTSKLELQNIMNSHKSRIDDLKLRYDQILKNKGFVHKRLEKAFPNLKKKLSHFDKSKRKND